MQIVYQTYRPGGSVSLQQFIIYFGIIELILSQLPHIHSLRFLNYLCTFCTIVFSTIVVGMCIHNREHRSTRKPFCSAMNAHAAGAPSHVMQLGFGRHVRTCG